MGFGEISEMPTGAILAYMERLPKIQAGMSIVLSEVVNLPWLEEAARKKIITRWNRLTEADEVKKKPPHPAVLRMIGIGVEIVRK